jgi:hypothetical protein
MRSDLVIPGLIGITEEAAEDGKVRFIFEIEDGREAEFFASFQLMEGDTEGFQRVVTEAISELLERMNNRKEGNDVT